jgi:hypothetical protein
VIGSISSVGREERPAVLGADGVVRDGSTGLPLPVDSGGIGVPSPSLSEADRRAAEAYQRIAETPPTAVITGGMR